MFPRVNQENGLGCLALLRMHAQKKRASMQKTHLKFPDLEGLHHCMSVLTKLSKKQIYFGMLAVINHGQRGQLPQEHANVKCMFKSWIPSVPIPLL